MSTLSRRSWVGAPANQEIVGPELRSWSLRAGGESYSGLPPTLNPMKPPGSETRRQASRPMPLRPRSASRGVVLPQSFRAKLRRFMPLLRPLCITAGVTALVALLSYALPAEWQSTGVGFCLLVATYVLVLRHDASTIRHYGLGLGGIFEPVPLDVRRILAAIGLSLLHALLAALV